MLGSRTLFVGINEIRWMEGDGNPMDTFMRKHMC